jgi:hypothetical protein
LDFAEEQDVSELEDVKTNRCQPKQALIRGNRHQMVFFKEVSVRVRASV